MAFDPKKITVRQGAGSLMMIAIGVLIIFTIILIYNYTVAPILPFLPTNQVKQQPLPDVHIQTLNADAPVSSDTALVFDSIPKMNMQTFGISFDCYLNGQYLSTDIPRVLLYVGTAPSKITSNGFKEYKKDTTVPQVLISTDTDLLTTFPDTNIIVYADDVKNDLKVALVTVDKSDAKYVEIAPLISNIPIKDSFQISIVVSTTTVEIYKNKQLLYTYILQNTMYVPSVAATFYSPINLIKDTIQIGNIQYFDNNITSSQVRTLTRTLKPALFFTKSN